jgi:hypothetical protein
MLLTIAIILLLLWALGFIGGYVVGWWIHLLLIVALIVFILNFVRGRPTV